MPVRSAVSSRARLSAGALRVDAARVARLLLGARLVRVLDDGARLSGLIVETEAYLGGQDRASHAFGLRRTARNESMYGPPGTAYVYFTYGMHHCFNVVCGEAGDPQAVLVRALEPVEGREAMASRRGTARVEALCSGPAKLCEAMGIDRSFDGADLLAGSGLYLETTCVGPARVRRTPRIGVAYAGAWAARPLRFVVAGHPCLSRPLPGVGSRGMERAWKSVPTLT